MAQLKITMKRVAWLAIIGVPLWFIIAALGSKFGIWSWQFGLGKMTMAWGKYVMIAGLGIGVVAFITAIAKAPRTIDIIMAGLIAIIIPVMAMANGAGIKKKAAGLPFIHDISTDRVDPPMFTALILDQRREGTNPVDYVGKKDPKGTALVSELQAKGYPDIQPQSFGASPDVVSAAALHIASESGIKQALMQTNVNGDDFVVEGMGSRMMSLSVFVAMALAAQSWICAVCRALAALILARMPSVFVNYKRPLLQNWKNNYAPYIDLDHLIIPWPVFSGSIDGM